MAKIVTKVGIEVDGKILVGLEYDQIYPVVFSDGEESDKIFATQDGDEKGLLILTGDEERFKEYGPVNSIAFANKKCICVTEYDERLGEKAALLSTEDLHELTCYAHDMIFPISDELYITKKDGLYGVVNHLGKEIIQNEFTNIAYDEKNHGFIVKI